MTAPPVGYYGLVVVGDGWRPVTNDEHRHTLALTVAREAGATHVGYWDGKGWRHVEPVDEVDRGAR